MGKILKAILIFVLAFMLVGYTKAPQGGPEGMSVTGYVISVLDGDTIKLDTQGNVRIRLAGIDAPEKSQPYGLESKNYLASLIGSRTVTVIISDTDRYGRYIGTIIYDGMDINAEMLRAGYAWHYKHYSRSPEYASLEKAAREQRLGLWADDNPTAPWKYRAAQRKNR